MLKKENLLKMAEVRDEWCVSIYLPINQADSHQNRERLKQLMFESEKKLLELGMEPVKVARILIPIELMLDNLDFWKDRTVGFAAFLTLDSFVWFSCSGLTQELSLVTDRFHLMPLLRNSSVSNSFYLLTLSRQRIKFFEASETGLKEIILRGMPRSLDNFLLNFEQETNLQFNPGIQKPIIFPQYGGAEENRKIKIAEVFRKVDKVISKFLENEDRPLILAGTPALHAIYHSINSYQNIVKDGFIENIDKLSQRQLLDKLIPIINSVFQSEQAKAIRIYQAKYGTDLASDNFTEIFKASNQGRIETLFVPINQQTWGIFDEKSYQLQIHQNPRPGDKDLLCVASTNTLLKGGKVFAISPEEMPNQTNIAAVLRS
ncbi:MAG TPA: hypothetical protein PKY82_22605 [Pyrinomonadaceae bacterium]|nr:hypothetical protein [Pyrinomonadaceae bacterium]